MSKRESKNINLWYNCGITAYSLERWHLAVGSVRDFYVACEVGEVVDSSFSCCLWFNLLMCKSFFISFIKDYEYL